MRLLITLLLLAVLPCGAYAKDSNKKPTVLKPVSTRSVITITDNTIEINNKIKQKRVLSDTAIILISIGATAAAIGTGTAITYAVSRSISYPEDTPSANAGQALIVNPQGQYDNPGIIISSAIIGGVGAVAIGFGVYFWTKASAIKPPKHKDTKFFIPIGKNDNSSVILKIK